MRVDVPEVIAICTACGDLAVDGVCETCACVLGSARLYVFDLLEALPGQELIGWSEAVTEESARLWAEDLFVEFNGHVDPEYAVETAQRWRRLVEEQFRIQRAARAAGIPAVAAPGCPAPPLHCAEDRAALGSRWFAAGGRLRGLALAAAVLALSAALVGGSMLLEKF